MDFKLHVKWLSLFESELVDLLVYNQDQQNWDILDSLLPYNSLNLYKEEARKIEIGENETNIEQLKAVAERLWQEIVQTPNTPNLLIIICQFVGKTNPDLLEVITHQGVSSSRLAKFLTTLIRLEPYIDTDKTIQYLSNYSNKMSSILCPIWRRLKADEIDESTARRLIFRNIPFFGLNSVQHLMYVVWTEGGIEGRKAVERLEPGFERLYDHILSVESRSNRIIVKANVPIEEALKALSTNKSDPLDIITIPTICKMSGMINCAKELPLNLRNYQNELAQNAVDGKNTLICAPTNSGKTLVSVYVMRKRYYYALDKGENFKSMFLVPTRILVEQQYNVLQKYFPTLKIKSLVGNASGQPDLAIINEADICVTTPQMFLNALKINPVVDAEKVKIENFTLVVFDEAHRANEKHPYNEILKIYHDTKISRQTTLPQIVGLTASTGVGEAKNTLEVVDYICKICANLDVKSLNHVRIHVDELRKHAPITMDEIIKVDNQSSHFFDILISLKVWLENELLELLPESEKSRKMAQEMLNMGVLITDIYSEIMQLSNYFTTETNIEETTRQKIAQILNHMITVNNTARCVRLFDRETAISTFRNSDAEFSFNKVNKYTRQMQDGLNSLLSANDFEISPMLAKLIEQIEALFQADPDSRCLIFMEKRKQCALLADILKRRTKRETCHLTGKASSQENGVNEKQQSAILTDFRSGKISILCVTSVADEGLDIAECKLVIKYNYVTNAIAHVQRRGRGRAQNTRSILLAESDLIRDREEINIKKEAMMNEALRQIDWDLYGFFSKVDDKIRENEMERNQERLKQEQRGQTQNRTVYVMLCRKCDGYLARSTQIFRLHGTHYLVADPTIWQRVVVNQRSEVERPDSNEPSIGKISCQNNIQGGKCSRNLGSIIIHKQGGGILLPIFKCTEVVFQEAGIGYSNNCKPESGRRITYAQWSKVTENLFPVPELRDFELAQMAQVRPNCHFNAEIEEFIRNINKN